MPSSYSLYIWVLLSSTRLSSPIFDFGVSIYYSPTIVAGPPKYSALGGYRKAKRIHGKIAGCQGQHSIVPQEEPWWTREIECLYWSGYPDNYHEVWSRQFYKFDVTVAATRQVLGTEAKDEINSPAHERVFIQQSSKNSYDELAPPASVNDNNLSEREFHDHISRWNIGVGSTSTAKDL